VTSPAARSYVPIGDFRAREAHFVLGQEACDRVRHSVVVIAERFAPLPPEKLQRWATFGAWPDSTYFSQVVGIVVEELRTDYARMRLPYRPELNQPAGVVHGGAIATLLDTVMACAVHTKLAAGESYTTLDFDVRFVRGVNLQSGRMRAVGDVVHIGRRVATAKGELADAEGRLCAHATTTCLITRPEPAGKERG